MKQLFTLSWLFAAALGQVFGQCPPGETELTMAIVADRYGLETTWEVTGEGGSPVYASGGPYTNQTTNGEFPQPDVDFCVPDGAVLEVTVSDTYGDGMCCAYGEGSWTLRMGATEIASGGSFGTEETALVALGTDLGIAILGFDNIIAQGSTTMNGLLLNNGINAVNSFTLSYTVDGGAPVTQTFNTTIQPGGSYVFTFDTPWEASVGDHTITVSISGVENDVIGSNNEITQDVAVATQSVTRRSIIEEFTSSTCAPCAGLNETFDPLLNSFNTNTSGSNVLAVKYQMNWPSPGNDPSYNSDGNTRKNYYGVSGIPDVYMNGGTPLGTTWANAIENATNKPAFCDIAMTHTVTGATVDVEVVITPYANFSGSHKLFIVATQDYYYYPASTTSQDEFHYAMRKILPNGNGITVSNLVAGVPQTFNQSYTFTMEGAAQNNFNTWTSLLNDITLIAFLQHQSSKTILQGAMSDIVTSINELGEEVDLEVYPNPTTGILNVGVEVENAGNMNITLTNIVGEVVLQQNAALGTGRQNLTVDMSSLANGSYYITLSSNDSMTTRKVTLTR